MAEFTIKNEKGLVSGVVLNHIMTYKGLEYLDHLLSENPQNFSKIPSIIEDAKSFVSLIKKLHISYPYLSSYVIGQWKADHSAAHDVNGFDENIHKGYVIPIVDQFKSNSPTIKTTDIPSDFDAFGWQYCEALAKLHKKITPYLEQENIWVASNIIEDGKKFFKKMHQWEIVVPKAEDILLSESFAIYHAGFNGFLNDKGRFLPLSAARLFESQTAAERTVQSRSLRNVVIVKTQVMVTEVCQMNHMPSDLGALAQAMALKQSRELHADVQHQNQEITVSSPVVSRRL